MITPTAKQKIATDLLQSFQYDDILFDGGSRAGKTFCIIFFYIACCLKFKGIRLLVARLNFNHVKASIWLQDLPKMLSIFKGLYRQNHSDYIVSFPSTGSEIWFGGLDTKERAEKVFGQEYASIFLNEAVQLSPSTVDKVETRLAQKVQGFKNFMIYDCNPRHPEHFLYKKFYIEKQSYQAQLLWTPHDNVKNLSPGYIERLGRKDEISRARFLEGKWVSLPGAVYPGVKAENIITVDKDFRFYDDIACGLDFGLNTAFVLWAFKHNKAYCMYEITLVGAKESTTKNIISKISVIWWLRKYSVPIYCDHEPDRISELIDAGFNAKKAPKDVGAGDSTVNEHELFFDTKCCNTFQSMLNLVHQVDENDNFIDKHVKENDHHADASRYAQHGRKVDNAGEGHYFF